MELLLKEIESLPYISVLLLYLYAALSLCVWTIALRDRYRRRRRASIRRLYHQRCIFYQRSLLAVFGIAGIAWIFQSFEIIEEGYAILIWAALLVIGFLLTAYGYLTRLPYRRSKNRKKRRHKFIELEMIPHGAALMIAIRRQKILAQRNHFRWYGLLLSGFVTSLLPAGLWFWFVKSQNPPHPWSDIIICAGLACAWMLCWLAVLEHRIVPTLAHCPYCFHDWGINDFRKIFYHSSILTWDKCPGCGLRLRDHFPDAEKPQRRRQRQQLASPAKRRIQQFSLPQ